MNRISFQWRITLMTAVLIAGACICLNLLLYALVPLAWTT